MNQTSPARWLDDAVAQGLLPADAALPVDRSRPWPVVLLTALGAWLAAVPLFAGIGLLIGEMFFDHAPMPLIVGALLIAVAVTLLRAKEMPIFFEQMAVPALCAGLISIGLGLGLLMKDSFGSVAFVMSVLCAALAWWLPQAWLRTLLGLGSAVLLGFALSPWNLIASGFDRNWTFSPWFTVHVLAAGWLIWAGFKRQTQAQGRLSQRWLALEPFAAGWAVAVLGSLAWNAGQTFLLTASFGDLGADIGRGARDWANWTDWTNGHLWSLRLSHLASAVLALAAAFVLGQYDSQRAAAAGGARSALVSAPSWGVAVVLAVLAWLMPDLGMTLLIAAVCLTTQRYKLAALAGFVAAWIIGGFYYQLTWPLATKGLALAGIGAALAALVWWAHHAQTAASASANGSTSAVPPRTALHPVALLAGGALLTLGVANFAIWDKENVIASGQPVFVRLAPRDPRSLMQGDYMALNFSLPQARDFPLLPGARRPLAVGKLDAQRVATFERIIAPGQPVAADEIAIELTPKDGNWILVTDAWFFKEGQAERWGPARYGELRVAADGHALLVGIADEHLKRIEP